jgi:hypothetical protein
VQTSVDLNKYIPQGGMSMAYIDIIHQDAEPSIPSVKRKNNKDTQCCGLTFGSKILIN